MFSVLCINHALSLSLSLSQLTSHEINHHGIVVAFSTVPPHKRNADATLQGPVDLGLVLQLWVLRLYGLQLNSHLLIRNNVGAFTCSKNSSMRKSANAMQRQLTEIDIAKGA